jgi:hypothetical protein
LKLIQNISPQDRRRKIESKLDYSFEMYIVKEAKEMKRMIGKKALEGLMRWKTTEAVIEDPHLPPVVSSMKLDYFILEYLLYYWGFEWNPERLGRILTTLVKEGKLFVTASKEIAPGILFEIELEKRKEPGLLDNLIKSGKAKIIVDDERRALLLKLRR